MKPFAPCCSSCQEYRVKVNTGKKPKKCKPHLYMTIRMAGKCPEFCLSEGFIKFLSPADAKAVIERHLLT